jgi:hypothetical protein
MTFQTTVEITPDDDGVTCGMCRERKYGTVYCSQYGEMLYEESIGIYFRCPACLAAEKAAKERPRMLQECPECHGDRAYTGCHTCDAAPHPGWVEAKP